MPLQCMMSWDFFHSLVTDQKHIKIKTRQVIFIAALLSSILCTLPPFVYGKKGMLLSESVKHGSENRLETALNSTEFKLSVYTSIVLSIPMLVEFLLDWYYSMHPSSSIFQAMWALLMSIIIPNTFLLLAICPRNLFQFIPSHIAVTQLISAAGVAIVLSEYGGHVLNNVVSYVAVAAYFVLMTMSPYAQFHSRFFQNVYMNYLRVSIIVVALGGMSINIYWWVCYLKKKKRNEVSNDDMICSGLLLGIVSVAILGYSYLFGNKIVHNFVDRNTSYLTITVYVNLALPFVVIIMVGRMFRYEVSRLHERRSQELDQKRSFVRYISHEIRTPLNTVLMGLQLLKREVNKLPSDSADQVGAIVEDLHVSCNTAVDILNEILDFEKLQAGILELEIKEIPLVGFVDECVTSFQVQAREKNINLQLEYESQVQLQDTAGIPRDQPHSIRDIGMQELNKFSLRADPWKLSQVLRNLLSNAIKFTKPEGCVLVDVVVVAVIEDRSDRKLNSRRAIYAEAQNTKVVVKVTDTGAGISKENQSKLFKEIVQFEPGKLQEGKGSGLGLWISKQIVDLHKGSISVFSEGEGKGSVFTLELPVERLTSTYRVIHCPALTSPRMSPGDHCSLSESRTQDIDILLVGSTSKPPSTLLSDDEFPPCSVSRQQYLDTFPVDESINAEGEVTNRNILLSNRALVVDDAPMNRKMLLRLLEGRFQTLDAAEDGQIAVQRVEASLLEGKPYDIILMDYQMPNMDGPTAAQSIRDLGFTGPIIGVTGNALPVDVDWFISHGATHVVPKPVDFDMLMKVISSFEY